MHINQNTFFLTFLVTPVSVELDVVQQLDIMDMLELQITNLSKQQIWCFSIWEQNITAFALTSLALIQRLENSLKNKKLYTMLSGEQHFQF